MRNFQKNIMYQNFIFQSHEINFSREKQTVLSQFCLGSTPNSVSLSLSDNALCLIPIIFLIFLLTLPQTHGTSSTLFGFGCVLYTVCFTRLDFQKRNLPFYEIVFKVQDSRIIDLSSKVNFLN